MRFLKVLGFTPIAADMSVFVRGTREGKFAIVVLHVHDQNVLSDSEGLLRDFKAALQAQYSIDDIGEAKYFLEIEVVRDRALRT